MLRPKQATTQSDSIHYVCTSTIFMRCRPHVGYIRIGTTPFWATQCVHTQWPQTVVPNLLFRIKSKKPIRSITNVRGFSTTSWKPCSWNSKAPYHLHAFEAKVCRYKKLQSVCQQADLTTNWYLNQYFAFYFTCTWSTKLIFVHGITCNIHTIRCLLSHQDIPRANLGVKLDSDFKENM